MPCRIRTPSPEAATAKGRRPSSRLQAPRLRATRAGRTRAKDEPCHARHPRTVKMREAREPSRPAGFSPVRCFRRAQLATMAMPKGLAPVGSDGGDDASSIREPPLTAKPLTDAIAASTTYRWSPLTSSRASNGRICASLVGLRYTVSRGIIGYRSPEIASTTTRRAVTQEQPTTDRGYGRTALVRLSYARSAVALYRSV
jgi:hypothetical protein